MTFLKARDPEETATELMSRKLGRNDSETRLNSRRTRASSTWTNAGPNVEPVNLILFETGAASAVLPRADPRAIHVLDVLRRQVGDTFDAGVVNGPRGKGKLEEINVDGIAVTFAWGEPPAALEEITLLIGMPRPQTARDILREATSLGVSAMHFFKSDRGEPSYAQSTLWTSGEWRRHLLTGAEQAFDTRLPEATFGRALVEVLEELEAGRARESSKHHPPSSSETSNERKIRAMVKIALDNYESPRALSAIAVGMPVVLAFGPERGWSAGERSLLRANGFDFAHLGSRVLRSETAVIASVAVVRSKLGLL
ncbi:MAG: rRNA methyltransferase [Verrucomicrobia bacterium]|nr:rRNA methyltransferase [Verrucomicrobiota bacterium]